MSKLAMTTPNDRIDSDSSLSSNLTQLNTSLDTYIPASSSASLALLASESSNEPNSIGETIRQNESKNESAAAKLLPSSALTTASTGSNDSHVDSASTQILPQSTNAPAAIYTTRMTVQPGSNQHNGESRFTLLNSSPSPLPLLPSTHSQSEPTKSLNKKKIRLAPSPEKLDRAALERAQLVSVFNWCAILLLYVCIGFYVTSIVYDVWQEDENDSYGQVVDQIKGKNIEQYFLLSFGSLIGIVGAIGLTCRIFATPLTRRWGWIKFVGIVTTVIMIALGRVAATIYPKPNAVEHPRGRLGAGWEYADNGFQYGVISIVFLVIHECSIRVVQRFRTDRHLSATAAARLKSMKHDPIEMIHARQIEITKAHLQVEQRRNSIMSARNESEDVPPNTRPNAPAVGEDIHVHQIVKRLLRDKDTLSTDQLKVLFALIIFFYVTQFGGIMFALIEDWDLRQGIQFSIVTVATIGYGNVVLKTTAARALLFVYFPVSFGLMSYTISLLWTQLFTRAESHYIRFSHLVSLYCLRACRERKRRQLQRRLKAKQKRLAEMRGLEAAVRQVELHFMTTPRAGHSNDANSGLSQHRHVDSHAIDAEGDEENGGDEAEIRQLEDEWDALEHALEEKENEPRDSKTTTNRKLVIAFAFVLFLLLGGAAVFYYYQTNWSYFDSVYFCFVTLTTIGYGDLYPTVPETQTFVIYYVLIGLGALAYVLSLIQERITVNMEKMKRIELPMPTASSALTSIHLQSIDELPTWNERFLAANLELEKLVESMQILNRNQLPPSDALINEFQMVSTVMDNLSKTVGQRQIDKRKRKDKKHSSQPTDPTRRAHASAEEDDLDLSSFGIFPSPLMSPSPPPPLHPHPHPHPVLFHPPEKRSVKVVLPRSRHSCHDYGISPSPLPPNVPADDHTDTLSHHHEVSGGASH